MKTLKISLGILGCAIALIIAYFAVQNIEKKVRNEVSWLYYSKIISIKNIANLS